MSGGAYRTSTFVPQSAEALLAAEMAEAREKVRAERARARVLAFDRCLTTNPGAERATQGALPFVILVNLVWLVPEARVPLVTLDPARGTTLFGLLLLVFPLVVQPVLASVRYLFARGVPDLRRDAPLASFAAAALVPVYLVALAWSPSGLAALVARLGIATLWCVLSVAAVERGEWSRLRPYLG